MPLNPRRSPNRIVASRSGGCDSSMEPLSSRWRPGGTVKKEYPNEGPRRGRRQENSVTEKEALTPRSSSYGWVVVAAAFTLMCVGFGAAYSFAAFFTAFEAEFGASRGHIALVFSVAAFLWFACGAPGGMLGDRFGPRCVTLAGVVCLAA